MNVGDVDKGVYVALTGHTPTATLATGGVWNGQAAQGTTGQYVTFQNVPNGSPVYGLRGHDPIHALLYLVKALSDTASPGPAISLADTFDDALQTLTVEGVQVISVKRRQNFRLPDPEGGWQVGAYYEVMIQ